jgi:hypothetical protein
MDAIITNPYQALFAGRPLAHSCSICRAFIVERQDGVCEACADLETEESL